VRALGAALALLAVAGCGGLSREEYNRRGDRVLRKAVIAVEADKQTIREHPRDPAAYRALAKDLRAFAADLEDIGEPPTGLGVRQEKIIDKMREGADRFDDAAKALAGGDIETFQREADEGLKAVDDAAR
jgi:hypothetical protein